MSINLTRYTDADAPEIDLSLVLSGETLDVTDVNPSTPPTADERDRAAYGEFGN